MAQGNHFPALIGQVDIIAKRHLKKKQVPNHLGLFRGQETAWFVLRKQWAASRAGVRSHRDLAILTGGGTFGVMLAWSFPLFLSLLWCTFGKLGGGKNVPWPICFFSIMEEKMVAPGNCLLSPSQPKVFTTFLHLGIGSELYWTWGGTLKYLFNLTLWHRKFRSCLHSLCYHSLPIKVYFKIGC